MEIEGSCPTSSVTALFLRHWPHAQHWGVGGEIFVGEDKRGELLSPRALGSLPLASAGLKQLEPRTPEKC